MDEMGPVAEDGDPADAPACASCSAILFPGARFCDACGTQVGKVERGPGRGGDTLVRAHAAAEMARAVSDLRFVRAAFWAAFGVGVLTAILVLPLAAGETGRLAIVGVVMALHLGLTLCGALLCHRHPVAWTIAGACFFTLASLLILLQGGLPVIPGLTAVALWGLVPKTIRLRRLLAEYPDLRTARRFRGELPAAPKGAASSRASARARRLDSEGRRSLFIIGGIGAGILAAFLLWGALNRPPTVDDAVRSFVEAWGRGDLDSLSAHFRESTREEHRVGIEKHLRKRGWLPVPPPVMRSEVERADDRAARMRLFLKEGGNLVTAWRLEDKRWVLTGIEFPPR